MTVADMGLSVVLVLLVSSLFVLAMIEASMLHVRRSAVATDATHGDRASERLVGLLDDLPSVMNSVLLAVLIGQVTATAIAGVLAQRWFGGIGITLATVAVTVVLFVYGEAIPKTIAINEPIRHAKRLSAITATLNVALKPMVWLLVKIAARQSVGGRGVDTVTAVSERELLHLTDEAAAQGQIGASDAELIERSFVLGDLRVDQVLVPLDRVVSVPIGATVGTALEAALRAGHRRLPVYDGTPERLVGFVRLRDLAAASMDSGEDLVARHVRDAVRVDSSALIIDVLRSMQTHRRHIAFVAGRQRAVVGIVTVEDIVEELLGEIDEPEPS